MQSPMFWCSGPDLASAARVAGLIGSLTRNHCRDMEELENHLAQVAQRVARFRDEHPHAKIGPLAVNISSRYPANELHAHVTLCRRYGASIIVTAVGDPRTASPIIRGEGLLHFHDAVTTRFAEKAVAAGADGIIAIGAGGGGHSGHLSHLAFVPEVRSMFEGIVIMAGGVTTGAAIRAAEILGADIAYMGTRFIATRESMAPDEHKQMLVEATSADVLYTDAITGIHASWLRPSLHKLGLEPEKLPHPTGHNHDHLPPGTRPWRNLWSAGQGVSLIFDIPTVAQLTRRLQQEYVHACSVPDMLGAVREALSEP